MSSLRSQPKLRGIIKANAQPARTRSRILRTLFDHMQDRCISQASVAEALGRTPAALSNWKAGHSSPDPSVIEQFAEVLGFHLVLEKIEP